jgi:hypothetical protein
MSDASTREGTGRVQDPGHLGTNVYTCRLVALWSSEKKIR